MRKEMQVFVTTPTRRVAEKLCTELLKERVVACAQILGPIVSHYWWQGRIEKEREWLCILKTDKEHYQELEKKVKNVHPYDIPEIIGIPIETGSASYFNWLRSELKKGG